MEDQATQFIVATRAALAQASAMAVQYSFSILGALVLIAGGWLLASLLRRWSYEGLSRIRGFDETLSRFFSNVLRYALLILVFITALGQFGVQTASIIAALGAAGLAIGLALQGTLQNIAAGIMLLVLRPFRVGEYIETSSVSGTVREIGLFATELRTSEGLFRLAPNSTLWNVPITNFSREHTRRFEIKMKVGYADDIEKAERLMLETAKKDKRVLKSPAPETFVSELTDSSATVTLHFWASSADYLKTSRDMIMAVKRSFDADPVSAKAAA